jgi:hypothetical protein
LLSPARFRRLSPSQTESHTTWCKWNTGIGNQTFRPPTVILKMNVSLSKPTTWCKWDRQTSSTRQGYLVSNMHDQSQSCMDGNSGWLLHLNKAGASATGSAATQPPTASRVQTCHFRLNHKSHHVGTSRHQDASSSLRGPNPTTSRLSSAFLVPNKNPPGSQHHDNIQPLNTPTAENQPSTMAQQTGTLS